MDEIKQAEELMGQIEKEVNGIIEDMEDFLGRQSEMLGFVVLPEDLEMEFVPDEIRTLNFD